MLLQFNFKNCLSFRDEATLDLTATRITDFPDHVVTLGGERILPVAAIYGANASGKTNVQQAFCFMTDYVIHSIVYSGELDRKDGRSLFVPPEPFAFDADARVAPSSFEVYFLSSQADGVHTYQYGFVLSMDGIREEWLNVKYENGKSYKPVFYREGSTLEIGKPLERSKRMIPSPLPRETLLVSLGKLLPIGVLQQVYEWFYQTDAATFGDAAAALRLSQQAPDQFSTKKSVQQAVLRYLSSFDPSIAGFNVEQTGEANEDGEARVTIDALHHMIGSKDLAAIPLRNEAAGTLKMFSLYPKLQSVLQHGGVFFADELNARLHPLLMRAILVTFLNPETNPNHAQLLFTTHDPWNLNILRRDEIWLTEKDADGISSLYSLYDFADEDGEKIRKDENFEKNYLLGKYGGIPAVQYLDLLGGE